MVGRDDCTTQHYGGVKHVLVKGIVVEHVPWYTSHLKADAKAEEKNAEKRPRGDDRGTGSQ